MTSRLLPTALSIVLGASALIATPLAHAASSSAVLTVETVLSPAWIERADGKREPLAVGMALTSRDKIHTGDSGRALMRLAEGSAVKVGESAMVSVGNLVHRRDASKNGVVAASLEVIRGAFRFTTGLIAKRNAGRDVRIKVNAVTAGIRGTDVWGKSEAERDIVCLLEGRIEVTHGAAQFAMAEAGSFYIAPRQGQAQAPSRVSPEQIKQWSAETEIVPGTGATRSGGTAFVRVSAGADQRTAQSLRDKLRDSGFPADAVRATNGQYEVRIQSVADASDAAVLAKRLQSLGFTEARAAQ